MPFVVYEQGVRIHTPPNRIFPPATVAPVSASERLAAVDPHPEPGKPVAANAAEGRKAEQAIAQYRQQEEQKPRSEVFTAGEIMTRQLLTLRPDDSVALAWQYFQQHTFHHIPVTDTQGRLLAMLSDRDVWLRLADWQAFQQHQSVSEIMQSRVVCATEDTDIRVLAGAMAQNHIGSVPIIDAQGDLCGIVTRTDILLLVTTHPRFELWT